MTNDQTITTEEKNDELLEDLEQTTDDAPKLEDIVKERDEAIRARDAVIAERQRVKADYKRLQAQVTELQMVDEQPKLQQAVDNKSPLEKYAESEDYDPDGPPPTKVLLAEKKWEQQQASRRQAEAHEMTDKEIRAASVNKARMHYTEEEVGEGLDFTSVTSEGHTLLTATDKRIIGAAGPETGEVLYERCLKRLVDSGTSVGNQFKTAVDKRDKARLESLKADTPSKKSNKETGKPQSDGAPTIKQAVGRDHKTLSGLGLDY